MVSSGFRLAMAVPLALSCLACVSYLRYCTSVSLCGKTSAAGRHYDQVRRGDPFYANPCQTAMDVATSIRRMLCGGDRCPHTIDRHLFRRAANEWRTLNRAFQHTEN